MKQTTFPRKFYTFLMQYKASPSKRIVFIKGGFMLGKKGIYTEITETEYRRATVDDTAFQNT